MSERAVDVDVALPAVTFACAACGRTLRARPNPRATQVKCPHCKQIVALPDNTVEIAAEIVEETPLQAHAVWSIREIFAVGVMVAALAGCAVYANLAFAVTNPANFQFFPPFRPFVSANDNRHLGAEYFCIARSLVAGEGFANPFQAKTGPTAWMPPVLPCYLAALLWLFDGNVNAVMTVVIVTQTATLIVTGLLVIALARQCGQRLGVAAAAALFLLGTIGDFHHWFQHTHDCWIVLLALDLVVAGYAWATPLASKKRAAAWGVCGGFVALISPIAAFAWGLLCLALAVRQRAWARGAVAVAAVALTLSPWVIRNYVVFGRLIPVKSNVAYELWQSQCVTPDGLLQVRVFATHPYSSAGTERQQYRALGEMEFLDRKRELFWQAVKADPLDFLDRVACRGLGATLWYIPSDRRDSEQRPWLLWVNRAVHPLPFLALLFLLATAFGQPLHAAQWLGIGVYCFYLTPYIAVSYYDRYAMPLLAVKVLLVLWAADRLLCLLRPGQPASP